MSWADRVAILLDGEYVKKVLHNKNKRFPTHTDVMAEVRRIQEHDAVKLLDLYRIFYYTADPLSGKGVHPLDGTVIDFGSTPTFSQNSQLINKIENEPDVAVRRGVLAHQGWEIGQSAVKALTEGTKRSVEASDIKPKIVQKGVDMRIGLDIASLALKRLVSTVVIVTGDSDMVPVLKFARREGLRVFLDTIQSPHIRPELKIHADRILS